MTRATHDAIGWVRDCVQSRILAQIFTQRMNGLVIKGGMAMRVAHDRHARATKDIDMDASHDIPLATLQQIIRKAIDVSTRDQLLTDVKITEPKQTETTNRWKIAGTDPRTGQVLHLTVEISRRDEINENDVRQLTYGCDKYEWVQVYKDEIIAFQKIKALMSPTREAPRDISDLYLLIQASVQSPVPQLRQWLKAGGVANLEQMWEKVERMDSKMFKTEVLPSLPPTPDGQYMYQDWEKIRLTVAEKVEQWIKEASDEDTQTESNTQTLHCSRRRFS